MKAVFFDIDDSIVRKEYKLSVIDKNDPSKVIFYIKHEKKPLLKTYYKKYNLKTEYNGHHYYLSPEIFDKIKKIKKDITLDRIGITNRGYNEGLNRRIELLTNNIIQLRGQDISLFLLTGMQYNEDNKEFVDILKSEIKAKLKLKIEKVFFINSIDDTHDTDLTSYRKALIILEYATGFKIKMGRFTNMENPKFEEISFYDDQEKNVDAVNNIQKVYKNILKESSDTIKDNIKKISEVEIKTYHITNNKLNPFIINTIQLKF